MNAKFATVAIVGMPNAGKSTLMNYILGNKISIITYKPQTTRNFIRGIYTQEDTQIVFIDTPGINQSGSAISKFMMKNLCAGIYQADLIIVLISALSKDLEHDVKKIQNLLTKVTAKILFVLNKIDMLDDSKLNSLIDKIAQLDLYKNNLPLYKISAKNGSGISNLLAVIKQNSTKSTWLYKKDQVAVESREFIASEITRETMLLCLKKEVPHQLIVITTSIELINKQIIIGQDVLVARESHKAIILGKKGEMIGRIAKNAAAQLTCIFNIECKIKLFIKVKKDALLQERFLSSNSSSNTKNV